MDSKNLTMDKMANEFLKIYQNNLKKISIEQKQVLDKNRNKINSFFNVFYYEKQILEVFKDVNKGNENISNNAIQWLNNFLNNFLQKTQNYYNETNDLSKSLLLVLYPNRTSEDIETMIAYLIDSDDVIEKNVENLNLRGQEKRRAYIKEKRKIEKDLFNDKNIFLSQIFYETTKKYQFIKREGIIKQICNMGNYIISEVIELKAYFGEHDEILNINNIKNFLKKNETLNFLIPLF